ncbi:hypothetical protein ALC62_11477 [Cyphomyrmex costatus]|uniref:BED-type domain-containing protein n=1 Tax=Cyphomyrmex costatus TaxID=456900 RepID=A0A151ICJ9_9HYME|nr:hypothetical protein ALC62_11477 [Cyphomyrmex costatus]
MSTSTASENIANKVTLIPSKDLIKQYYVVFDSVSKRCTLCNNIYKHHNNTTNLKNHLKRKHKAIMIQQNTSKKITSENENNCAIDVSDSESHCSLQSVQSDSTNAKDQTSTQKQVSIKKAFSRINEYNGNLFNIVFL